ncbi:hypothetical protein JVU11DRAFT_35 [Chiua virens]|nr:hypothetical protein JVU11DRAFT_35 [Chiua virens]
MPGAFTVLDRRMVTPTPANSPSSSVADIQEFLLGERVHALSHNNYRSSCCHCHCVHGEDAQTVQQANLFEDEHLPTRSRTPDSDMESMVTAPEDSENKSSAGLKPQVTRRHVQRAQSIQDLERIHTQSDQHTSEVENEGHKKIAELQDVIQRLESEHETHCTETDQHICNVKTEGQRSIAKLQATIQQLESEGQKKIVDLQEVIQQLESDLERIRTQSDQRTSEVKSESHKKIAELQGVIQRLKNERETHHAETDQRICNVETEGQRSIAKLQEIIQQLESKKIVDLQEVIQRLESEHEAYRTQMDQTSEVEIEISKLKETIQWLESEQATHHTQSERDRQTDVEHKNKIAQLQRDIQQRESDCQATTLHHKNEIEQLLKRHEAENTGLHDQLDKIQQTVAIEQKVEIETLQKEMKRHETENERLRTQIDQAQRTAALQHESEIKRLRDELKIKMDRELEQCERKVEKNLRLAQEAMMAQKETEIASLEQRYMQVHQSQLVTPMPDCHDDNMDICATVEFGPTIAPIKTALIKTTNPRPSIMPPKPTSVMPHLDAIKKVRKTRGVSRRSHLISVAVEDEGASHLPNFQQQMPNSPPLNIPNATDSNQGLTDAVTKGVEAALKSILTNHGGRFSPNSKPSPRRRKVQDQEVAEVKISESKEDRCFILEKVRKLFQDKCGFTQDTDFMACEPTDPDEVRLHEDEDGPGPDLDSPKFNLQNNSKL